MMNWTEKDRVVWGKLEDHVSVSAGEEVRVAKMAKMAKMVKTTKAVKMMKMNKMQQENQDHKCGNTDHLSPDE